MTQERFKLIPAVYLVLRRQNEVLLLRRANTGYQDGKYSLIAGHLDGDELATEGLIREAEEEAGITVKVEDLQFVHMAHRLSRGQPGQERIDLFFDVWQWEGDLTNMEPEKCDELTWQPINNLPNETIPFVKLVLTDIAQSVSYSEYSKEPI